MAKINARNQIIQYITTHHKARVSELWRDLGFSRQLVQRKLKQLVNEEVIQKSGTPPLVFYHLSGVKEVANTINEVPSKLRDFTDEHYLYVSPLGEITYGFEGFVQWVQAIHEQNNLVKLLTEYKKTYEESRQYSNTLGFIDATDKIKRMFSEVSLEKLFYLDFYALPKFGKTKLGQLVLYAKQAQNHSIIKTLSHEVKEKIEELIKTEQIDAVSFVPPTVPRKTQFMKEFEKMLELNVPTVPLKKVYSGDIPVAQKTLSRLGDRVENAAKTIFISGRTVYNNVLVIDDAVGSGASLNETAKKLITEGVANRVIGFAIVGSYKGFDVIQEV